MSFNRSQPSVDTLLQAVAEIAKQTKDNELGELHVVTRDYEVRAKR